MRAHGINTVRLYTVPPRFVLDAAHSHGLKVLVGLPWEQHITFLEEAGLARDIERRVRDGVTACARHPALLGYTIGNEIPASIVRWHGRRAVERFLWRLYRAAKAEDPTGLVTYVNFPTTEYLQLPFLDFHCFNVYLEARGDLDAYLARLQNLAGDKPLVMAEIGLDSRRNGEEMQATVLAWQMRSAFAAGCAGAMIFAWTDEWHRGGYDIEDWDFGLTRRDRTPKPALTSVREAVRGLPFPKSQDWPRISVVVCSFNGSKTIRDCLDGATRLNYPDYEIIVVDDGSWDGTASIAEEYGVRVIRTSNQGLSSARNTGLRAATGEIIAYTDDDARPDPNWLMYMAASFCNSPHVGMGGPNIAPDGDGFIALCVANAPGGPSHVLLSDLEAEHIPGCNMAFRKAELEAIGGFDPQFRQAGDDVDVCWRLQANGGKLGFSPGAMVWHHRRNRLSAYWKQQIGYGRAEALLEKKWPEKYNSLGHLRWTGRLYGRGLLLALGVKQRIYHGTWNSAAFQSLYEPGAGTLRSLPLMPEWYLGIAGLAALSALGIFWEPLFIAAPFTGLAILVSFLQAAAGGHRAELAASTGRWVRIGQRMLIAGLYLIQPAARLWGRLSYGLTPWRRTRTPFFRAATPRNWTLWSEEWRPPEEYLRELERALCGRGAIVRCGGDFDTWDVELRGGLLGKLRTRLAIEEHGGGRQYVKFRSWPVVSRIAATLTAGLGLLALIAGADGAWEASAILGAGALLLAYRIFGDYATAKAALGEARLAMARLQRPVAPGKDPVARDRRMKNTTMVSVELDEIS